MITGGCPGERRLMLPTQHLTRWVQLPPICLVLLLFGCTTVTVQVGTENSLDDSIKARRSIERNTTKKPPDADPAPPP